MKLRLMNGYIVLKMQILLLQILSMVLFLQVFFRMSLL